MIKSSKPPETPPEQKPGEEPFTVIYAVFGPALVQTPSLEMLPSGLQLHQVRTGLGERVPPARGSSDPLCPRWLCAGAQSLAETAQMDI